MSCSVGASTSNASLSSSPSSRPGLAYQHSPPPPPPDEEPFEHPDDMDAFFSLDLDLELPTAMADVALAISPPVSANAKASGQQEHKNLRALAEKAPARPAALTRVTLSSSAVSSSGNTTTSSSTSTCDSPSPSSSGFDSRSASDSPALTPEKVAIDSVGSLEASVDALVISMEPDLLAGGDEMFGFLEPESDSEPDLSEMIAIPPPRRGTGVPDPQSSNVDGAASSSFRHPSSLAPEVDDQGNLEYKLQILPNTRERFDKLVTQMKWRLLQGGGLCVYEVGVLDDGTLVGLDQTAMRTSLVHLADMGREMGAELAIRRVVVVQRDGEPMENAEDSRDDSMAPGQEEGSGTAAQPSRKEKKARVPPTHPALRRYLQRLKSSGRVRRGAPRLSERSSATSAFMDEAEAEHGDEAEVEDEQALSHGVTSPLPCLLGLDDDGDERGEGKRVRAGKRRRNAARAKQAAALRNAQLASSLGNGSVSGSRRVSSSEGDSGDNDVTAEGLPTLRMLTNSEASQLLSTKEISRFGKSSLGALTTTSSEVIEDFEVDLARHGAELSYRFEIDDEEGPDALDTSLRSPDLPTGARLIVEAVLSRRLMRNEAFIDFAALP